MTDAFQDKKVVTLCIVISGPLTLSSFLGHNSSSAMHYLFYYIPSLAMAIHHSLYISLWTRTTRCECRLTLRFLYHPVFRPLMCQIYVQSSRIWRQLSSRQFSNISRVLCYLLIRVIAFRQSLWILMQNIWINHRLGIPVVAVLFCLKFMTGFRSCIHLITIKMLFVLQYIVIPGSNFVLYYIISDMTCVCRKNTRKSDVTTRKSRVVRFLNCFQ